jgi:hypothetical protein
MIYVQNTCMNWILYNDFVIVYRFKIFRNPVTQSIRFSPENLSCDLVGIFSILLDNLRSKLYCNILDLLGGGGVIDI